MQTVFYTQKKFVVFNFFSFLFFVLFFSDVIKYFCLSSVYKGFIYNILYCSARYEPAFSKELVFLFDLGTIFAKQKLVIFKICICSSQKFVQKYQEIGLDVLTLSFLCASSSQL